MQQNSS